MAGHSLVELPPQTVRLLGSGQVITSVYSVVKELVENSFDAGCTSIDIKLEGYGLEKIEICDNGHGIRIQDIPYVAKRHYTSKLVTTEDMLSLETYGFRGEALASLCAVSQVTIATKTQDDEVSYIYDIDSEGNMKGKKPSCLGTGTTVTARNLFFNLPVRKQFYNASQRKKDDLKRIEDLLIVFGVIRPQMRISLRHDRDIVWQKIQTSDTKGAIHAVLSRQVFSQLLCVEKSMEEQQGSLCAYLPKPGSDVKLMSRSTADRTLIVVNERPVHIKGLVKVLKRYYCNCHGCDTSRFPICYVHVKLPAADVDVNVDPNKTTVFLKHLSEVRTSLEELLLKMYGPLDNVPSWHYSEAVKDTQKQTSENNSAGVVPTAIGRKQLGKKAGDEVKGQVTSDFHNNNCASRTMKENDVDKSKPLPSFTMTFHKNENSSAKHSDVDVDSEILPHRTATFSSSASDNASKTLVNNTRIADHCSKDTTMIADHCSKDTTMIADHCSKDTTMIADHCSKDTTMIADHCSKDTTMIADHCSKDTTMIADHCSKDTTMIDFTLESLNSDAHFQELMSDSSATESGYDRSSPVISSKMSTCDKAMDSSAAESVCDRSSPVISSKMSTSYKEMDSPGQPSVTKKMPDNQRTDQRSDPDVGKDGAGNVQASAESKRSVSVKAWSMGHGMKSANGGQLQPVKLLSSSSLETPRKRPAPLDSSLSSRRPMKERKISADNGQSENTIKTSDKKTLKRRQYQSEKPLDIVLGDLRDAVLKRETQANRIFYETPTVIGQAESCDAWFCGQGDKLSLINIYRLGEAVLYRNLKEKHRLLAKLWQSPIDLCSLRLPESLWQTLERLARSCETRDTYFHISDERLVANGFDIRCHRDPDGKLLAELVGMCDLIPTYRINDLSEVLEMITNNPLVTLGDARPTKVLYYLQGEVYRMLQDTLRKTSVKSVQEMISQLTDAPGSTFCIHQKPVFHDLFDFSEVNDSQGLETEEEVNGSSSQAMDAQEH